MFKEKILAQLKAKYSGVPNAFLEFVAAKIAAKATEESQIEGLITELDNAPISISDQALFFQQEGDRRVSEATKKKPPVEPAKPAPTQAQPKEGGESEENPMMKMLQQMQEQLSAMQKKETQTNLSTKLKAKLAEKKIPDVFANYVTIESEDQFDSVVTQIEGDWQKLRQDKANEELGGVPAPNSGTVTNTKATQADKDIADWAGRNKPAAQPK